MLISCDEQKIQLNFSGKIDRIEVKGAYLYQKLIFDYPSSNMINIDIIDVYGDQAEPEKLILTYDSAGYLIAEKLFSSNGYIYHHNYIYEAPSLIIETIRIKPSGDSLTTYDTLKLNSEGKVIKESGKNVRWLNDNLVYYKSEENVRACFVPSNMGGVHLTLYYTPLTVYYKYDNHINPFRYLNFHPGSYFFGASKIMVSLFNGLTSNMIEASVTEEFPYGMDCYKKATRKYMIKNLIQYNHDYPIQMTIKEIEDDRERQIQEIYFEYMIN
ncbi:MAG: hypothetical protein AMS27_03340 [Bacteroides sp. SM23_62_1]|nr:MAG: hypothetical protein AMS27_03340 [Bacteroides sp. SM23_62_1]